MEKLRDAAPPSNDGGCVTLALAQGRDFVAGRDWETEVRHRSIAPGDKLVAAEAAISGDPLTTDAAISRDARVRVQQMGKRMQPTVQGSRCHHSHPAHHRASTMASQSPAESATITGRANPIGSRASVTDASVCGSARTVIRTSAFGSIN